MSPALPRAILFDLDDTLLAYDAVAATCWQQVCERLAPQVPGATVAGLVKDVREYSRWFWSDPERHRLGRLDLPATRTQIVAAVLARHGVTDPALAAAMGRLRHELHLQLIAPFPGALATVQRLRAAGVKLGMITNGAADAQRHKIARFQLAPLFHAIVIEGEFGVGKPQPDGFRHLLATLGVAPAETWMVGDNLEMDLTPAKALGLYTVWNDFRGTGLPADAPVQPDRIVRSVTELV